MDGDKIRCPCVKWCIKKYIMPNLCERHLIKHGFMPNYYTWSAHGEQIENPQTFNYPRRRPARNALNTENEPIWPSHLSESKLSAIVRLLNIKSDNNWSERGTNETIDYIRSLLPNDNVLPESYHHMKKLIDDLGLPVMRIDVCKQGCMLFWRDEIELESCKFCNDPRYNGICHQRKPNKQLFYLPLAPRLQRLYASHVMASHMTWHAHHRTEHGLMCHPSDGDTWKSFDQAYPDFSQEVRNVRLGPKSPQKNIDVYLQPLIAELKMLWSEGVRTYDVSRGDTFNMNAMLLWTINDFPTYGMLSGWSTHGIEWLPNLQFLPIDHLYRKDTEHFLKNITVSMHKPTRPNGVDIWDAILQFEYATENPKGYPRGYEDYHKWTKKSIFWELPYWGLLLIRHNIDFMHVEKNVFENIINIVMNVKGKTKDNINSRKDMFLICNRPELHIDPRESINRTSKAVYALTRSDNKILCDWLKGLKLPDGYASNLSRCFDRSGFKLIGLKSNDCHVFLERLLPIAFKHLLPKFVWGTLTNLSIFMHDLSSRTLSTSKMQNLEGEIPVILCNLAKIFPPCFF
ncbi:uncharacterized protein LOC124945211 [Impatiens glandulifera]|uniref:uncharacterized protein LOC124945211 n=1 Tax=Impatiens glandulifera TaxID=253017 RepID=UPI001FB16F3C|nr:uncharacterized protein LOC124945211 [Impatiens glandulifera]